jgi:hypothetical protein
VLSYFAADGVLAFFCYGLFAVLQIVLVLAAYQLIKLNRHLLLDSSKAENSWVMWFLSAVLLGGSLVVLQVVTCLLSISVRVLITNDPLPPSRAIDSNVLRSANEAYAILALMVIALIELVLTSALYHIFTQDTSLKNNTAWSATTPFAGLFERAVHIYVHCDFILGSTASSRLNGRRTTARAASFSSCYGPFICS